MPALARPLLSLLLLLPLAAHADGARQPYTCDNGSRFELSIAADADGRPHATLHFADGDVVLPQVPATVGAFYRNEAVRLHTHEDEARLEDEKGNVRRCRQGEQPPGGAPVADSGSFVELAGQLHWRTRIAVPPQARVVVRVVDRTYGRILADLQGETGGQQSPLPFQTLLDRDLIGKKSRLVVRAHIELRGKRLLAGEQAWQAGRPLDLELKAVARAPR